MYLFIYLFLLSKYTVTNLPFNNRVKIWKNRCYNTCLNIFSFLELELMLFEALISTFFILPRLRLLFSDLSY